MALFSRAPAIQLHHDTLFHRSNASLRRIPAGVRVPAAFDNGDLQFSSLTSSVAPPSPLPLSRWTLDSKHVLLLNFTACAAAISASWVFFSAIPTLLAFRRAAESLEKLMDVTAGELPDTMAAIRLSGMEISDLTMELSNLGQEITQGVRSSTRAVRVAGDRLRCLISMGPSVSLQVQASSKNEMEGPMVAKSARNLREGIVKGREVFGFLLSVTRLSRWVLNFWAGRTRKQSL